MNNTQDFDGLSFILQGGFVSITVAIVMLLMSVASWYFMLTKTLQVMKLKAANKHYIESFWSAENMQAAMHHIQSDSPAHQLAANAMAADHHHQTYAAKNLSESCNYDEFIARSMRRSVVDTQVKLESGLSVLASVGSVAPFVGLFGTVWGIYHALASISASGQATLDKVAGPVGEALIMTAIGLAVAIPAVLAYNAFVKQNRNLLAILENFAQDLHVALTTGARLKTFASSKPQPTNANANANMQYDTANVTQLKGMTA